MLACAGVNLPLERTTFSYAFEYRSNTSFDVAPYYTSTAVDDWTDTATLHQLTQKLQSEPLLSKLDSIVSDNSTTFTIVAIVVAVVAILVAIASAICMFRTETGAKSSDIRSTCTFPFLRRLDFAYPKGQALETC